MQRLATECVGGAQSSLVRSGHETNLLEYDFGNSIGVKLGLEDHELRTIEQNYHGGNERCKLEMLSDSLSRIRKCQTPTWKAAADALQQMEEHELSLKTRAKYCSSSADTADTADTAGMYPFVCL